MSRPTNLTRIVVNLSRGNARVPCVTSAPQARSATEAFESVMRMMRTPRSSVCQAGDVILDRGEYYTLAYFNITERDNVFRMFHTPFQASLKRKEMTIHPVTKLKVSGGLVVVVPTVYFNVESRNPTTDVLKFDSSAYRIITSTPLEVGDVLGDHQIMEVREDNGLFYCQAKPGTQ